MLRFWNRVRTGHAAMSTRRIIGTLIAASALLVPIIVAVSIYWARQKIHQQNPQAFEVGAPTISRVISEPDIAMIFATAISFAAALLALVCWRIIMLYHAAIKAAFRQNPRTRMLAKCVLL